MGNVKLHLKNGKREIILEGEKAEVEALMTRWWLPIAPAETEGDDDQDDDSEDAAGSNDGAAAKPAKPAKKRARRTSPASGEGKVARSTYDATGFANGVKQDAKFARIQSKIIIANPGNYRRVAFVCWRTGEGMTSGEIQKCLTELGIKIALPRVSEVMKNSSNNFTFSEARTMGSTPRYKLTAAAAHDFEQWFNADA